MKRHPVVILAALAAVGAAGCGSEEAETPTTTVVTTAPEGTPPGAATTTAATPPTNDTNAGPGGPGGVQSDTAEAIRKAIVNNTQMTGSRVTPVVNSDGVATLTGFTQNQQQKALAEKAARETAGVTSVKNKIEIRPTGGVKPTPSTPTTQIIVVPGGRETAPARTAPEMQAPPSEEMPPASRPSETTEPMAAPEAAPTTTPAPRSDR